MYSKMKFGEGGGMEGCDAKRVFNSQILLQFTVIVRTAITMPTNNVVCPAMFLPTQMHCSILELELSTFYICTMAKMISLMKLWFPMARALLA